jgi:hypothetical protein
LAFLYSVRYQFPRMAAAISTGRYCKFFRITIVPTRFITDNTPKCFQLAILINGDAALHRKKAVTFTMLYCNTATVDNAIKKRYFEVYCGLLS